MLKRYLEIKQGLIIKWKGIKNWKNWNVSIASLCLYLKTILIVLANHNTWYSYSWMHTYIHLSDINRNHQRLKYQSYILYK